MSDLFEGIETVVPGNQGGVALTKGEYVVKVTDIQQLTTQMRGEAFIVEYEVVESSDAAQHPIGSKRSWYQSLQNRPVALGEIVKFMYAALGYDSKRDEERIKIEVTPNIKAWTNAACKQKIMNGKVSLRVTVQKKAPSEKAILKAKAEGKEVPTGYDNPRFSPLSPNPPPARPTN